MTVNITKAQGCVKPKQSIKFNNLKKYFISEIILFQS